MSCRSVLRRVRATRVRSACERSADSILGETWRLGGLAANRGRPAYGPRADAPSIQSLATSWRLGVLAAHRVRPAYGPRADVPSIQSLATSWRLGVLAAHRGRPAC